MTERITILVDGRSVLAPPDQSLAAVLLNAGVRAFRRSLHGDARAPLCGMGACFECRVRVDGVEVRACLEPVRAGMRVTTGEGP